MWRYEVSDGTRSEFRGRKKEDVLLDIAYSLGLFKWFDPEDPIYPDFYIYNDDKLDEVIIGKELASEREIREYNKSREEYGLPTI